MKAHKFRVFPYYTFALSLWLIAFLLNLKSAGQDRPTQPGCLRCHGGIEPIRDEESEMMGMIRGLDPTDTGGCVICHGGNPSAVTAEEAHSGAPEGLDFQVFIRDPGSLWVAEKTCGVCHEEHVYALQRSLMMTEAGKIQGNLWSWGVQKAKSVRWGNYTVDDPDGPEPVMGSSAYKDYVQKFIAEHPGQMVQHLEEMPALDMGQLEASPNLAGLTYQRQECQRCHVGVRGRERRGDYRGLGCSACHIPYGNEGFYEGGDLTIAKDEPGHLLVHQIQATREAKVAVNGKRYSGIPTETCNTCHNRGKRIGVSFQGLMEFPYGTPLSPAGEQQPQLHTKYYLYIKADLHSEAGMLCQDCHTSIDVHGDGNIAGTTLAQVEIECQDCHGTLDRYPWELPLGFSEEFGAPLGEKPRGLAFELEYPQEMATVYAAEDGYLITARGNPLGNVVRRGSRVILHSATGAELEVPVLKEMEKNDAWVSPGARVAMAEVSKHMDKMECYACHANWAPQCYGCHITVDFSGDKGKTDWIAAGKQHYPDGSTAESEIGARGPTTPGEASESRGYLRWEEPILGINGEGRVTPLMPGCQVVTTVIGRDGQTLAHNRIWRTGDGLRGLDMSPVQPHTMDKKARECESCHSSDKALGYGIDGGRYLQGYQESRRVDLADADGNVLSQKSEVQLWSIPDLPMDWSQIVTREGLQLQTVGSHWELSRPLNDEERRAMERTGACLGCHREMTNDALWRKVSSPATLSDTEHTEHMNTLLREAANLK